MGNSYVKNRSNHQSAPEIRRYTAFCAPYASYLLVYAIVLAVLICPRIAAAQDDDRPDPLPEAVQSAVHKLIDDNSAPEPIRMIIPANGSELERYCAVIARFHIEGNVSCDADTDPLRQEITDETSPGTLGAKNTWKLQKNAPEPATGLLVRVVETEDESELVIAAYAPQEGKRTDEARVSFSLPQRLQFLGDAEPEKLDSSNRRWLALLKQLFPPPHLDQDAEHERVLAEACHFFRRGLWEQAATQLDELPDGDSPTRILYRVFALHLAGEGQKALERVDNAIKRQPDSGPLYALKAWLLHQDDNTSDALMILQQGRLSDVQREGLYHLAHHLMARDGDDGSLAKETIQKAAKLEPDNKHVQLMAAEFYWNNGELEACVEHYEAAIEAGANEQYVLAELGVALSALGKNEEAQEAYQKAFDRDPADNSVARQLSSILRERGEYEKALQVLSRSARKGPETPKMYLAWGKAAASMWETREAIRAYRAAIEKDGAEASTGLAAIYARQRRFEKALDLLEKVIKDDPSFAQARVVKAEILMDQDKMEEAIKVLETAKDEVDDEVTVRVALARAFSDTGEHDKATNEAQTAVASGDDARTHAALVDTYTADGDWSKAESALELGQEENDTSTYLLNASARLNAARDKPQEALDSIRQSLDIDPHQPTALILAGEINKKIGDIDQCARDWSRASGMDRWNPGLEWRLAELLRNDLDSPDQAIPHYKRHSELDGEHADKARQLTQQLEGNDTD